MNHNRIFLLNGTFDAYLKLEEHRGDGTQIRVKAPVGSRNEFYKLRVEVDGQQI